MTDTNYLYEYFLAQSVDNNEETTEEVKNRECKEERQE